MPGDTQYSAPARACEGPETPEAPIIEPMGDGPALSRLHYELIQGLLDSGACPDNRELAHQLGVSPARLGDLLRGLAEIHGVVLHPHVCAPWVIHPFSLTPAINWIECKRRGWWAPCVWCALGVATLAGGEVTIHTRCGGESDPLAISVRDGQPIGADDVWVHFAIPPSRAWDNVHQHCSMVLPFRSPDEIQQWCHRHGLPYGQAVPLSQTASLARIWYGSHADHHWHKWTVEEAQAIFHEVGLNDEFWNLGDRGGKF